MSDLSSLKVGDPVVIWISGYGSEPTRGTKTAVTEITKAGNFKLADSEYVWLKNGRYRGQSTWDRLRLEKFDQDAWDRHQKAKRERDDRHKLRKAMEKDWPIDTVRAVLTLLQEYPNQKGATE